MTLCQHIHYMQLSSPFLSVCRPFVKRYYLQYQWMPFYVATLSLMYYLPYVFFRIINTDMISLKSTLTKEKVKYFYSC